MPSYEVNRPGVEHALRMIREGKVDRSSDWSEALPGTDEENRQVDEEGYDGFGRWHLAIDPSASDATKGRYAFPYGDYRALHRDGLVHAKQRAAQYGHDEIEAAAGKLLEELDG